MDRQTETDRADIIRDDFKAKVKCWFENKGILKRLELYLKNQMILEFQRNCGQSIYSQSTALSPKLQAIKMLVGDFLLQEDLLFSLSVYSTEVPFLLNLTQYNRYVSRLSDSSADTKDARRLPKPKFSKEELVHILEALNLNLKASEFDAFHNVYKSGTKGSLLTSLLGTIPKLIKKHRTLEYLLKKARKREKLFQKLLKIEKSKLKNMYVVVQNAYGVVEKHKSDMNKLLESQNVIVSNEKELSELSKKESELTTWQERLELRERSLEKTYQNQLDELEERANTLEKRELELQSKYQMLQQKKYELEAGREHFERARDQQQDGRVDESNILQEFEQKFYSLQAEVREMLESYSVIRQKDIDEGKLTQSESSREQQTENETFPSVKEYVNFMEKENTFLKFNSRKQRNHIGQLTNEVVLLKRRLDYLEKKVELRRNAESEMRREEFVQAAPLSRKHHLYSSSTRRNDGQCVVREPSTSRPGSRRKLFEEDAVGQSCELSSSNASKETNLTDDIMADANSKIEVLENESEALDRNCRNLHNILSRNMALSESKSFGSISVLSESSPRLSHLSGSYSDVDSPFVERKFRSSSPRTENTPSATARRLNSFRELFIKCRIGKIRSNDTLYHTKAELEYSSTLSSPREKIDDDDAKISTNCERDPDQLSNNESTDIV